MGRRNQYNNLFQNFIPSLEIQQSLSPCDYNLYIYSSSKFLQLFQSPILLRSSNLYLCFNSALILTRRIYNIPRKSQHKVKKINLFVRILQFFRILFELEMSFDVRKIQLTDRIIKRPRTELSVNSLTTRYTTCSLKPRC